MARTIITICTSECAQMDLQQPVKTSKFYSRCKMCDIKKTLGVGTTPLVARRLTKTTILINRVCSSWRKWNSNNNYEHIDFKRASF